MFWIILDTDKTNAAVQHCFKLSIFPVYMSLGMYSPRWYYHYIRCWKCLFCVYLFMPHMQIKLKRCSTLPFFSRTHVALLHILRFVMADINTLTFFKWIQVTDNSQAYSKQEPTLKKVVRAILRTWKRWLGLIYTIILLYLILTSIGTFRDWFIWRTPQKVVIIFFSRTHNMGTYSNILYKLFSKNVHYLYVFTMQHKCMLLLSHPAVKEEWYGPSKGSNTAFHVPSTIWFVKRNRFRCSTSTVVRNI